MDGKPNIHTEEETGLLETVVQILKSMDSIWLCRFIRCWMTIFAALLRRIPKAC